jgi:quercetin dioxygenase-like cupin family protein
MQLFNRDNATTFDVPKDRMDGDVVARRFCSERPDRAMQVVLVEFGAGVQNVGWHTHSEDQVLVVTEGRGIVATRDDVVHVTVGDVVECPAGEEHWHGAQEGSTFAHLSFVPARATPAAWDYDARDDNVTN